AHFGVPIVLVTGDQVTAREAREALPNVECVIVKESITRYAASNLHPQVACERLREGAARAIAGLASQKPPAFEQPVRIEVTFLTADMAESSTWLRGVELVSGQTRAVTFEGTDTLALFRTFVTMIQLTRALVE